MQLPNYTTDNYVFTFGKMFGNLAAKNNAAARALPARRRGGDPSLNLSDGIHPNAAGQRILAENVWRVLEPSAREVASTPASNVQISDGSRTTERTRTERPVQSRSR